MLHFTFPVLHLPERQQCSRESWRSLAVGAPLVSIGHIGPTVTPRGRANCSVAVAALDARDDSSSGGGGTSLTISECADILHDAQLGDSISINGTTRCHLLRLGETPQIWAFSGPGPVRLGWRTRSRYR